MARARWRGAWAQRRGGARRGTAASRRGEAAGLASKRGLDRSRALLLSGHPELARLLYRPGVEPLRQRAALWLQLLGLDRDETALYLHHYLALAGCTRPLFTPAAIATRFEATKGLARAITASPLPASSSPPPKASPRSTPPLVEQALATSP